MESQRNRLETSSKKERFELRRINFNDHKDTFPVPWVLVPSSLGYARIIQILEKPASLRAKVLE